MAKQELSFMIVTDFEPWKVLRNSEILILTLLGDTNGFIINVNTRGGAGCDNERGECKIIHRPTNNFN